MRTLSDYIKMALAVLLVLASAIICALRLMKIQVVDSDAYSKKEVATSTYTQKIPATRGEIVDAAGEKLIGNYVCYAVVIDEKSFPSNNSESNEILLRLTSILSKAGNKWADTLPITPDTPYDFAEDAEESKISTMKHKIGVNAYATAENCMTVLCKSYGIGDQYTEAQKRQIAGIRYTMLDDDFSISNRFQLAKDLSLDTVTQLSELSMQLQGVTIEQLPQREIFVGDVLPHELGTTGPIYAETADEYLAKGYDLNATVGVSGIEYALEDELQGTDGVRTITFENGIAVSDEITEEVDAGHTIQLTVNSEFQRGLQDILDNFLDDFGYTQARWELIDQEHGGALVVLDATSGAVLGEVTAPTFDLTEYSEHYSELLQENGNPLFNRATQGLYRPGSTFKTITATAGLNEGIVDPYTSFWCDGTYMFGGMAFHCTGNHSYIAVAPALRVSCNCYFYELSRLLTIDNLMIYADLFGVGKSTGLETGDAAGWMATPEKYRELGLEWTSGAVLQAGIGNGDTMMTPLQMACVANTIANRGVRYQPYLVDSIWDYNMEHRIKKTEPKVVMEIPEHYDYVFDSVTSGMILASGNGFPDRYSLEDLGYSVAIKTGTPQVTGRVQDSAFIGFAPADDPKIAFAGIIEGGEYSKYMIRSICQLYEEVYGDMTE